MYGQIASGVGSLAGGMIASDMLDDGRRQANRIAGQGVDYLKNLNAQQRQDFRPYMEAGKDAVGSFQNLLAGGNPATMPQASGAFNFNTFQDPSAQYGIDQSNAAINASAIASGAVGGGLGRAIAGNTQNLAQKAYQNAFDRYLKQNEQDFGQGQQIFQNQTGNYQTQLGGYSNLMGTGLEAAGTTGGISANLGSGVNQNFMQQGQTAAEIARQRADAMAGGISGFSSGISSLF